MSSEYSIHIHNETVKGYVSSLGPTFPTKVVRIKVADEDKNRVHIYIFVPNDRLWEVSRLFTDIGQSLAALAPVEKTPPPIEVAELNRKATG